MASPIRISILANASQARREMDGTAGAASKLGSGMAKFGKIAALGLAAAGAGAVVFGKQAISAASDAQQSIGATETVFGKFSKSVIKTSDEAATKFGLSAHSYRENANLIGSLLKNQGVSMSALGGETQKLISHAADLSATFGGTTKDSVDALGAALKGEFERLESYGISIKASTVSTLLAARGQDKLTGAAAEAAKRTATLDLIMQQSKSSVGAFGRESNTLAHQQQVLGAKFDNIKVKLGNFLLPLMTKLAVFVSDKGLPALSKFGNALRDRLGPAVDKVKRAISAMQPVFGKVVDFMKRNPETVKAFAITLGVLAGALTLVTLATSAWSLALSLNPIGIVVIAIAGLVAGLVYAYQHSEKFRAIVNAAWAGIKAATAAVFPVIRAIIVRVFGFLKTYFTTMFAIYKAVFTGAWNVIKTVTRVGWNLIKTFVVNPIRAIIAVVRTSVAAIKTAVSTTWNAIKTATSTVWNGIKTAVRTAIDAVMTTVRGIKNRVTSIFSGAGSWLKEAGKKIIQGLIDGVTGLIGKFEDKLKSLTDKIPKLKGPARKDAKLLRPAGELIIQGLIDGFDRGIPKVYRTLTGLTRDIGGFSSGLNASLTLDGPERFAASSATSTHTYTINVNVPVSSNPVEVGRQIAKALDAYAQAGGRRSA
jgi:phage-related protein